MIVGSKEMLKNVEPRWLTVNVGFDGTEAIPCQNVPRLRDFSHQAFDWSSVQRWPVSWTSPPMSGLGLEHGTCDSVEDH